MIVLGVMSGSSLDGLDMAIISVDGSSFDLQSTTTVAMPSELTHRLRHYHQLTPLEYIRLDRDYSRYISEAVRGFLEETQLEVEAVGLHGHTIVHLPDECISIQLGNGGLIASMIDVDVVTDFRIQDIARGGEGTPLAALADQDLFGGYDCYLNFGGIANITIILDQSISAYDICPCNQVLNHLTSNMVGLPFDEGGNIARKGKILPHYTSHLDDFEYWALAPPKSLDNNWIRKKFLPNISTEGSVEDVLATMTNWIASKVANEIPVGAKSILVTGGGAHNSYLLEVLQSMTSGKLVLPATEIIDYKEAILMAYMAYRRLQGQHNVLHTVTFATSQTVAGAHYKA